MHKSHRQRNRQQNRRTLFSLPPRERVGVRGNAAFANLRLVIGFALSPAATSSAAQPPLLPPSWSSPATSSASTEAHLQTTNSTSPASASAVRARPTSNNSAAKISSPSAT